ncbi:hypothetical protein [Lewinella sp. LCG006]|uniref:hypothetical protein n=1 Tax=Lewinella sp. LCG006 TaxID=3231911 RepID=UPI00345FB8FD
MKRIDLILPLFFVVLCLASCKSEYQQYVDQEMASGIKHDSLIFGMRMGQTRKDFFTICWDLNKQKIISQGAGANARFITDRDSIGAEANPLSKEMLFYGIFDENDVMRGMRMTYSFLAWSPWNEEMQSDRLLEVLRKALLTDYPGNDFIELKIKESEYPALVKIDGNRQILMYPKNDKDVVVKIEDLEYKLNNQWKKE